MPVPLCLQERGPAERAAGRCFGAGSPAHSGASAAGCRARRATASAQESRKNCPHSRTGRAVSQCTRGRSGCRLQMVSGDWAQRQPARRASVQADDPQGAAGAGAQEGSWTGMVPVDAAGPAALRLAGLGRTQHQWAGDHDSLDPHAWRPCHREPGRLGGGDASTTGQMAVREAGMWGDSGPPQARCAGRNHRRGEAP